MIIFGTRGVTMTPERGDFFCPSCNDSKQFARKRVRRFFTLYFIPLIPLDKLGEYIECQYCKDTFKENVLDYDPKAADAKFEAEFEIALRRVMALMSLADGVVDDSEIESMVRINKQITGQDLETEAMRSVVNTTQEEGMSLSETIKDVAPYLNNRSKEMVVKAAYLVAIADGDFQEDEQKLLMEIGSGLELTSAHLKGILAEMSSQ